MNELSIGHRVEMLLDDMLIDRMDNLRFSLTPPTRMETAITADRPWESEGSMAYPSALAFDGRYHLYYRAGINTTGLDVDEDQLLCYALSEDGIHWTKPSLGLVELNGSTANNILMRGRQCHNFTPFVDDNPSCPDSERIKAVAGYAPEGLFLYASADGLRFHRMFASPAVTGALLDSQNVMLYDAHAGMYRIYSRYHVPAPQDAAHLGQGDRLRAIRHSESVDLVHWSQPAGNLYTNGAQTEHLYTNATVACPGAEHVLLSFPMRFVEHMNLYPQRKYPGISDAVFMFSRDGHTWDRRYMDSWIDGGLDAKNWTQRNQMVARGILDTDAQTHSVYVLSHYCWPDVSLVRYAVRKHGFASLTAQETEGRFQTRPLIVSGTSLFINFRTAATGFIRVGIRNPATQDYCEGCSPDEMPPIVGNELKREVRFKDGALSRLYGKPVVLEFVLRLAGLYALSFGA